MFLEVVTKNPAQTKKLAKILAAETLKNFRHKTSVVALSGPLGSGKTTFIQGFARGLEIRSKILSPTFLMLRQYPLRKKFFLWHLDCYRLKRSREVIPLGLAEILKDPKNILVVEWAEKIKRFLPKDTLWLSFSFGPTTDLRLIRIKKT